RRRGLSGRAEAPARNHQPGGSRNIDVVARPLPVTFETDKAVMTADGKAFAEQWWDSLKSRTFADLLLVGHTDPRASDAYNGVAGQSIAGWPHCGGRLWRRHGALVPHERRRGTAGAVPDA